VFAPSSPPPAADPRSVGGGPTVRGLDLRTRAAVRLGAMAAAFSRAAGRGSGAIIGGRVTVALQPDSLHRLADGRRVVLVTGTNGKTTTTAMLTAALSTAGDVATNVGGANMPDGLVAALTRKPTAPLAVLEVDELHLPQVMAAVDPSAVVLLNLTRDQLDRVGEVNHLVSALRTALASRPQCTVVANADDPMVVATVPESARVAWVAGGGSWHQDATVCPRCARVIDRQPDGWSCVCGLARPTPQWEVDPGGLRCPTGALVPLAVQLPGRINLANAAMAVAAADVLGVEPATAAAATATITDVAGRYRTIRLGDRSIRMLLAKNPAGASETLGLLAGSSSALVLVINGHEADGRDLSWLWDVPFEQLRGRVVTASGERASDLSVRLAYAGVEHRVVHDPRVALTTAPQQTVDVLANYTAFRDLLRWLPRAP